MESLVLFFCFFHMFGNTITPKEAVGRHSLDDSPCTYTSGNIRVRVRVRVRTHFFLSNFFLSDYCHCLYLRLRFSFFHMFGNTITPNEAVGCHSLDDSPCTYTSGNIRARVRVRVRTHFFLSNFFLSDYCHCLYLRLRFSFFHMFGNTITPNEAVGCHSLDDSPCTYTSGNIRARVRVRVRTHLQKRRRFFSLKLF